MKDRESKETCDDAENINVWFIDLEASPSWIQSLVTKGKWMKGKLVCPKCQGRLGSFDFIRTLRCPCLKHELPSIHILKARVDAETTFNLDESSDSRIVRPNISPSVTRDLLQNRHGVYQAASIHKSLNKNEGHAVTIGSPNLQLIGNIKDDHQPFKTGEDSKSLRLLKTLSGNDIQKDNFPVSALETHSRSCFDSISAAQNKELGSLMNQRWNSVVGRVNVHGQNESSALRGINLTGQNQENSAVNLSNNLQSIDTNRTVIHGNNSKNRSISGNIEGVFLEQDLYPDLPSSSNTTRRRKGRRKNRFTVLEDQTFIEVSISSSAKEEDDKLSVPVIPEENLCAVCLDLYFSPQRCYPCLHMFCEPCLRRLAYNQPTNTACPLCRVVIEYCIPDQDLAHKLRTQFAKAYKARKHEERKIQQEYCRLPQKGFHFFHYPRNRLLRVSPLGIPYVMFKIAFYFLLVYVMFVGVTAIIQWQMYPEVTSEEFSGISNSHLSPRTGRSTIIR
ncbi:hypothetical protein ACJMK2_027208 [Sinanodonta woodiana]|uniref:RING-type domain-containing protein n=1 Tax=Sinanodonta woodiana TaxID=1069815 RepID=A0ABD3XNL3_SINWO